MGYSLEWISVAGMAADGVLNRLGLESTGQEAGQPRPAMWAITSTGRVVVVFGDRAPWRSTDLLEELSAGGSVVVASAESHVNYVSAAGWEKGAERWSVLHDSDAAEGDLAHFDIQGTPPAELVALRDEALEGLSQDPDTDYLYDVPLDLVARLGGWAPESELGEDLRFFGARRTRKEGKTGFGKTLASLFGLRPKGP